MPLLWKKVADVAIGGLTEVGFVPGSSLLLVVSHQGRGLLSLATGDRVARDRQEAGSWLDASRPAVRGIGPLDGQWIEVAGLAGGRLPATTADGWQALLARRGVTLAGPAGELVEVNEPEEIRAFGFSPDGATVIIASSPSVVIFQRDTANRKLLDRPSRPKRGKVVRLRYQAAMNNHATRIGRTAADGPMVERQLPAQIAAVMGDVRASTGCGWGSRNGCPSCLQELAERMVNGRTFALGAIGGAGVSVQLALAGRTVAWTGSATEEASQSGIRMRTRLADDADEFRVDLGSGGVVEPSRWDGTTMSTMTSVRANGVELGVETFGRDDDPLVLLAGGPTMLSWPDSVCERLAAGGQRVVRYDLRDCGASTTVDPEAPGYHLRDLAADAAALVGTLGAVTAHLGGVGVGGMVAQVAALDHSNAFSALTLVSTRPVAPGPVDDDLPDHDAATMDAVFSRPMPDWTDRSAVAAFAADGAELLGNDPEQARATAARIWDRTPSSEPSVQQANQLGMVFARLDCAPRWRQRLGELTLPTLVVHGRADPFFPVGNGEALADAIPAARLLVLDDMGTALRDAAADEVTAAMLAL